MAQARHMGKIVVEVHSHAVEIADPSRDSYALRPDAIYLITGGLGGMGLKTAAWMVEREKTVLDFLARQLGSVLGLDERSIDFDTGLTRMGLDSLMAVELRTKIHLQLRFAVPVIALLQGATLRQLARLVLDELASSEAPEVTETDLASPAQELLRTLPQMSDAEVDALLEELIAG